nr:MAG TPA: hypothetical protein [Caudoviricetes sp.]
MLNIENTKVVGWKAAIREMRDSRSSWGKSDSYPCAILGELTDKNRLYRCSGCKNEFAGRLDCIIVGENDLDIMTRLRNAGTDYCKFMQIITVYLDITAPLYWWNEFDTHKIDIVTNSCSLMHKIAAKEFTLEDFSHEHLNRTGLVILENIIANLNEWRAYFIYGFNSGEYKIEKDDKEQWWQMIQLLPSSYNQRRTIMLNYEVLANIYKSRRNHKLDEWHTFCDWIETLPYSELIIGKGVPNE